MNREQQLLQIIKMIVGCLEQPSLGSVRRIREEIERVERDITLSRMSE